MESYKIGNKANLIISSYKAGQIGDIDMQYDDQPYTVIPNVEVSFHFRQKDENGNTDIRNWMRYNADILDSIDVREVPLTNKILNLIFKKNDEPVARISENYMSDEDGIIYLNKQSDESFYRVFIYNDEGILEEALEEVTKDTITVAKRESSYLLVYYIEKDLSYSFDRTENNYITLDLAIKGNVDDDTQDMFIHIAPCSIKVDKNMYFKQNANTMDLTFVVVAGQGEKFITIK